MFKRRLYRVEHPNKDNDEASDDSSSSSSDDDSEPTEEPSTEEEEKEEEAAAAESPESGYKSEDGSDSDREYHNMEAWPRQLTSDDDGDSELRGDSVKLNTNSETGGERVKGTLKPLESKLSNQWAEAVDDTERDRALDELDDCVVKIKAVFKCRLCPRIVCLSQNTMRAHLDSKRHARSQKLYAEGRLKLMLNSDGEVEEEVETHAERHARVVASVQQVKKSRKRSTGRQRQKQRAKKRTSSVKGKMKTIGKLSSEVCKEK